MAQFQRKYTSDLEEDFEINWTIQKEQGHSLKITAAN